MRAWTFLLGGLAIWALHFFALYAIGSILPGRPEARWLTLGVTLPAVAGDALLIWKARASGRRDALDDWIAQLGAAAAAISLVAVCWQCAPALFV